jgi:FdhD protein
MDNFTTNQTVMYNNGSWQNIDKNSPEEISTTLTVNGKQWLTFMCSPFQIEDLAVGFLFNEHIIQNINEIVQVWVCKNLSNVDIWLDHAADSPKDWKRTSGCTGGQTKNSDILELIPLDNEVICPEIILEQFEKLLNAQSHYKSTRGIHCALLTNGIDINYIAEDIGRHNTIDKLAGQLLLNPLPMERKLILTTGRVSSEMLQKSVHIGASVVVSRTSPTSSAISTAHNLSITLIGYARRNQFIVYTHKERLAIPINNNNESKIFCN